MGQNEELMMYMLLNVFDVKYFTNVIKTIKTVKQN